MTFPNVDCHLTRQEGVIEDVAEGHFFVERCGGDPVRGDLTEKNSLSSF